MSRTQRDKDARIERDVVELHRGLGLRAGRVPLSGASHYQGNGAEVDIYLSPDGPPLCGEAKAGVNGEGFAALERWLDDNDFLALRRNNAESASRPDESGRDSSSEVD